MKIISFLLLLGLEVIVVQIRSANSVKDSVWRTWKEKHGRKYKNESEEIRRYLLS